MRGHSQKTGRSTEQWSEEDWVEFWRSQSKVIEKKWQERTRLCQEDFMLQGDCDKYVTRLRLVKTDNLCACVAVNWKVC
jgi:hypothetical protein